MVSDYLSSWAFLSSLENVLLFTSNKSFFFLFPWALQFSSDKWTHQCLVLSTKILRSEKFSEKVGKFETYNLLSERPEQ
jgi:hypothetical protein